MMPQSEHYCATCCHKETLQCFHSFTVVRDVSLVNAWLGPMWYNTTKC